MPRKRHAVGTGLGAIALLVLTLIVNLALLAGAVWVVVLVLQAMDVIA
jgi:hypothetical protein